MALLLLFGAGSSASADAGIALPSPVNVSSVDGTVSKVTGTVLDLIEGQIQIDVANATITSGDDSAGGPVPVSGIPVGARVVARVIVPDVIAAVVPPPPLAATTVVVFQAHDGQLTGAIQAVDVPGGKFTLLFHAVSTNSATKWSGEGPNGPVKGIADLAVGMFATVSVVNAGGLLATSVEAFNLVIPPRLIAFRGQVQTITPTAWTIAGRVVQVNSATKIVGDPGVGDTVDVVAQSPATPPGAGTAVIPVALSIIKSPVIPPPSPGDHAMEFDGTVESIPASPSGVPLGHWRISSRDVLVNALTKLDAGIVVGTAVHVKGSFLMTSGTGGSLFSMQFIASEIRTR
ncbi:MAG: DUF5666 domain-containing protein [Thermoanaerobaculia bacterium]